MTTYFDSLQRNYTDVPITEDGIETIPFLEATEGLVKLFGKKKKNNIFFFFRMYRNFILNLFFFSFRLAWFKGI
jgi:hypothetical protein